VSANSARLDGLTKDLWVQWQQTRQYWRDAKADEFERKYMQELAAAVDKTVVVMEELDKLLAKIRKDCE
jgi:hypothetical protein